MIFQSPALLAALASLPAIWWLLRARPPSPRAQIFPPVSLLARLTPNHDDAATPPFWLLLLRLAAAALLILGLSGPTIPGEPLPLPGNGTLLLVIDNDMMAAPDWNERNASAHALLDAAGKSGRRVILLPTASNENDPSGAEALRPVSAEQASHQLDALRPLPWSAERHQTSARLQTLRADGTAIGAVVYFSTGVATPGGNGAVTDREFASAMQALGSVQEVRFADSNGFVLGRATSDNAPSPDTATSSGVMARLITVPTDAPRHIRIRAHSEDGGTLALTEIALPAGSGEVPVSIPLPTVMRNRVDMLTIDGHASAATTLLLDEGDRLRPVGLIASGTGDTPLVGTLFYLKRALGPTSDLHTGSSASLRSQPLSVLIAPDGTLADIETRRKIADWVRQGGTLIRFAGRTLAGSEDSTTDADTQNPAVLSDPGSTLLPVPLMPAARQLGGTMSWGKPQSLADFSDNSPFHGLEVPKDVTVSRQVLAQPSADLSVHSWARLADGTPLVTHTQLGKGEIVLFHVTPTADWSNLPLSGLFVSMLTRLVEHASGVDMPSDNVILSPVLTLDGEGTLGQPSPMARGLASSKFGDTPPSPEHPPGLYGSRAARRALNVGDTVHSLSALVPTGAVTNPAGHRPDRRLGPDLLALGLLLLACDTVATIFLRGFSLPFRRRAGRAALHAMTATGLLLGGLTVSAHAQDAPAAPTTEASPGNAVPGAALETRLAYVMTDDAEVDTVSREGLQGLSDYVNTRTSAVLGHPDGVHPGKDDLAYYPLLYWPITPNAKADPVMTTALTTFMARGGMIIIDTQGVDTATSTDADTLAGEAPGSTAALRRVTAGLPIPPLMHLDDHHVLSHTFYLLHDFSGRYAGQPVWVAREGEAENDDVSPVIIGSADWAHAWAIDPNGDTRFAVLPGGDEQRRIAYRFGVNAVIYALTGNYKADQVHVPAILKRLGQ
ncbi:DUF4159 domain-containing protein [Acetobacter conturbans]|uniref:DUF4159 domain-containing protein n=1 Tax=Acetobacter conturbans TaxID=1737472 RepID=A0ABX0JZ00_9PROT|nr:DUF4159 domain-containing protein [Acetobacter conturbans]NHN87688.1 DUF4159 domain-containing protein [Acetobacter conturbans]